VWNWLKQESRIAGQRAWDRVELRNPQGLAEKCQEWLQVKGLHEEKRAMVRALDDDGEAEISGDVAFQEAEAADTVEDREEDLENASEGLGEEVDEELHEEVIWDHAMDVDRIYPSSGQTETEEAGKDTTQETGARLAELGRRVFSTIDKQIWHVATST
jgi:hypothetical protein